MSAPLTVEREGTAEQYLVAWDGLDRVGLSGTRAAIRGWLLALLAQHEAALLAAPPAEVMCRSCSHDLCDHNVGPV